MTLFDFKMILCGLTMTLCDLIMSSHALTMIISDFHSDYISISLYLYMTLTMTLCDLPNDCVSSQGLWVSSQWLCAIHNNCMTSTMILCDLNNDSLWSKQWLCGPSQRGCNLHETPCDLHNDLCALTMTVWPSQWLFFTLTMTICALTVTCASLSMIYDTRMNFWSK